MKKKDYLMETYMDMVINGEDFSDFKSPMGIYKYIKPYVYQITADDTDFDDDYSQSDLAFDIADAIFKKNKKTMKGCKVNPKKMF